MQPQPSTPTPPQTAAPLPSNPAGERRALSRVIWYAILNLVGEVAGFVLAFAVFTSMVASGVGFYPRTSIGPSGPTPQQAQGMLQAFRYLTLLVPFGVLFGLIAVILLWVGFRGLSKAGASEFSLPSKLLLCSVVAFVLLIPGLVIIFSNIIPAMSLLAPPGGAPTYVAPSFGSIILGLGLVGLGAILALIGLIGGIILGIWRVGSRYDQVVLKLGAIFTIIPLLNVVSPILIVVGVHEAMSKLAQALPAPQ